MSYNDFYKTYEWRDRADDKFYINYLLNRYNIKQQMILDIGCGSGRLSKHLLKHSNNVVGIDSSFEAIKKANASESSNYIKYLLIDLLNFEYPNKYDCLFTYNFSLFNNQTIGD
jgi:2-polyprenyl-3-methyl-5-hydroxy-6-metoxy-1,4-benzoquinol methylase